MSDALVQAVADRFLAYAEPFLLEPGDTFAFRLKIDHTARVRAFAEDIAEASELTPEVRLAARIAAVVHDVGRFPQYKRYRTFRDAESANHALLSVRHALREGLLADVPGVIRRLVLGAVYLHNVRALPADLPGDLAAVARLVRDADKLDIFRVMIKHFSQQSPKHPEVALHLKHHPTEYSREVLDGLMRRNNGDYRNLVWANDFKLMSTGWLYDMNYRRSCQILKKLGHLETIFGTLPDDPHISAFRQRVLGDLERRITGE